ncbi:MAG: hypothetical protein JO076_02560 [Verrucomicrobia bacterium]|nr:hypothetical protein [Verrucomicrobiota bacterium]
MTKIFLLCAALAALSTEVRAELPDYSFDRFPLSANEIQNAAVRAAKFWRLHGPKFGSSETLLAVEAARVRENEVRDLQGKLLSAHVGGGYYSQDCGAGSGAYFSCVMIFDTRSGQMLTHEGYLVADLPGRGKLARLGPYTALYIGAGA